MRILPINTTKFGYGFGDKTYYNDFHLGLDLICPVGTPVMAPEDGTIVGEPKGDQLGYTLLFKGVSGVLHRMGHLSEFKHKVGESVDVGTILALSGNTGSIVGNTPHCHYDISKNGKLELNNRTNFINPKSWAEGEQDMAVNIDNARAIITRIRKYWLKDNPPQADIEAAAAEMARYLNAGDEVAADKQFKDFMAGAPQGSGEAEKKLNQIKEILK